MNTKFVGFLLLTQNAVVDARNGLLNPDCLLTLEFKGNNSDDMKITEAEREGKSNESFLSDRDLLSMVQTEDMMSQKNIKVAAIRSGE